MYMFDNVSAFVKNFNKDKKVALLDGELYRLKVADHNYLCSAISGTELRHKEHLILANKDCTKFILAHPPAYDDDNYTMIDFIGEVVTQYVGGEIVKKGKGGGYCHYIR